MPKSRNRSRDARKRAKKKRLAREKILRTSSKVDGDKIPKIFNPLEHPLIMRHPEDE